jgi:conjugal transfer/entry exclusion protein
MNHHLLLRLCLAGVLACAAPFGNAGGGFTCGGCATEVTQVMNNVQMALGVKKQIDTVTQLVETYKVKYAQLAALITAGQSVGRMTLADVLQISKDLDAYQSALRSVKLDLGSMQSIFDTRQTEAKMLNLSFPDYYKREAARIQNNEQGAKARLQREVQTVQMVKADMQVAQDYSAKVMQSPGEHQDVRLLNSQMNLMLQQLTRLVQLTSEEQLSDRADQQSKDAARRAAALNASQALRDAQQRTDTANDKWINTMPKAAH